MTTRSAKRSDLEVHLGSRFQCACCGAPYFRLTVGAAEAIWAELVQAVSRWRSVAKGLGMQSTDLLDFEPAFA